MIPFIDLGAGYRRLRPQIDAAVARVLAAGTFILGPEVAAFERELAAYVGAPHAVGVASGTDALTLALRALDLGPGDEVLTVANAGVPPAAAIRAAGCRPRFVDVQRTSLLLDPELLAAARTARTRAVLVVHLYGAPAPLDAILAFTRAHGLALIEDCAHAHGARYRDRHVGTFGDVGCFSFYPTKTLGAFGDAGACVTARADLAQRLRELRRYGLDADERPRRASVVSRLDELQAAVLRVKLADLPTALAARRRLAARYTAALRGAPAAPVPPADGVEHGYHLYVVRSPARARVIEGLRGAGIGWRIHYDPPVHAMDVYGGAGCAPGPLPVTEQAATEVLSLPLYPELSDEAVERVAAIVRGA